MHLTTAPPASKLADMCPHYVDSQCVVAVSKGVSSCVIEPMSAISGGPPPALGPGELLGLFALLQCLCFWHNVNT